MPANAKVMGTCGRPYQNWCDAVQNPLCHPGVNRECCASIEADSRGREGYMRIKVLGCSGGVGPGLRTTSLLVDDELLLDAGTGVGDLSLKQMARVRDVFLTHAHLDHVCGLAFMADNLFDLIHRPVKVHATVETLEILRTHLFNWKLWPDFSKLPDEVNPLMTWHQLKLGARHKFLRYEVSAFQVV